MFDIGFLELLIIGVVGLLVLGPERLPKAARTAGLWVGRIKRSVAGMQREISAQLEAEELRQKLKEQERKLDDSVNQAKRSVESIADTPSRGGAQADSTDTRSASVSQRLDDAVDNAARDTSPSASASARPPASASSDDTASSEHKDSASR